MVTMNLLSAILASDLTSLGPANAKGSKRHQLGGITANPSGSTTGLASHVPVVSLSLNHRLIAEILSG
jgi:hypothetical protein